MRIRRVINLTKTSYSHRYILPGHYGRMNANRLTMNETFPIVYGPTVISIATTDASLMICRL